MAQYTDHLGNGNFKPQDDGTYLYSTTRTMKQSMLRLFLSNCILKPENKKIELIQ